MFPLILTVLTRDLNRGYSSPLRTVSIRGNIPLRESRGEHEPSALNTKS